MYEVSNIVDGKPVGAADERTTELIDPCTGEVFATAPLSPNVDFEARVRNGSEPHVFFALQVQHLSGLGRGGDLQVERFEDGADAGDLVGVGLGQLTGTDP